MPKRLKYLSSPLRDAAIKVKWAEKEIQEADLLIHNFIFNKPYAFFKEMNSEKSQETMKIIFTQDIPDEAIEHISSSIHHLRSALDAMAWAVANRSGAPEEPKSVNFPISENREKFFKPENQKKIAKFGDDWLAFIIFLKPYPGGDDLLCALHTINNMDKHRGFHYITKAGGKNIAVRGIKLGDQVTFLGGIGSPLRNETPIISFPPGNNPKIDLQLQISFNDIEIFANENIITSLKRFNHLVVKILEMANTKIF